MSLDTVPCWRWASHTTVRADEGFLAHHDKLLAAQSQLLITTRRLEPAICGMVRSAGGGLTEISVVSASWFSASLPKYTMYSTVNPDLLLRARRTAGQC